MLRPSKIAVAAVVTFVVAIAIVTTYVAVYADRGPTTDEFAVYAAFFTRLSADAKARPENLMLANVSSKLTTPNGESWTPAGLKPDPPQKALLPRQTSLSSAEAFVGMTS
jgi:hypothetical protein